MSPAFHRATYTRTLQSRSERGHLPLEPTLEGRQGFRVAARPAPTSPVLIPYTAMLCLL